MMIVKFFKALKAGESLTHAAGWKNKQAAANAVVVIFTVILSTIDIGVAVSDEQLLLISTAIVAVVNIYFTYATSKKVGLPGGEK